MMDNADLISRKAAIEWFFRPYSNEEYYSNLDVERALNAIPAVDAAPVVRCKDCMYFRPWRHDRGDDSRCEFWNTEMGAEDYCSQAIYLNNKMDSKRRDEDA